MKRFINGFLFVLITICIVSCSKETPLDSQGEVVFKFDGTIGSTAEVFEAGENNYFLSTSYQDSGPNEILLMRGEFLDKTNPTDNYLRFEFYGYDSVDNSNILQKVFDQTSYNSFSIDSTLQTVGVTTLNFNSIFSNAQAVINWDFGDGSFAQGDSVSHAFAPTMNDANVTMTAFYPSANCTDSVSNLINLLDPINNQVQFNVSPLGVNLDSFQFNATPGFNSYSWDFGNSTTQTTFNPAAQVTYTDSLRKTITLNASNALATSTWRAVVTPNITCYAAYTYTVSSLPSVLSSIRAPYKTCIITYKKNGTVYRSYKNDLTDQSMRNVFSLSSAQAYDNNPAGERTIRLIGSVNTHLYNVNNLTDSIPIIGNNISIAVAHP